MLPFRSCSPVLRSNLIPFQATFQGLALSFCRWMHPRRGLRGKTWHFVLLLTVCSGQDYSVSHSGWSQAGASSLMLPCFKNQMASSQHCSPLKMRARLEEKIFDVQLRSSSGGSKPGNARVKGSTVGCSGPTLAWTLFSDGKHSLT